MARVVPKLNLNKTPQIVEPYSLIFAKNIKLLKDNTIGRDDGIDIVEQNLTAHDNVILSYSNLIGFIPYNTKVFLFYDRNSKSYIFCYDEHTKEFTEVACSWKWSGGLIDGCVNINLRNETLLTIAEHFEDDNVTTLVPFKTININESTYEDDETIYTQVPNLGIVNFNLVGNYQNIIPNGVYQFFVRYEIKPDLYTSWIPVSKECFTANIYEDDTAQGTVRYMDTKEDSNNSFVFHVESLTNYGKNYLSMQVGFILSHDDSIVARSWKKFSPDVTTIYFDYDQDYIKEINVTDLINPVFGLYNVKNVTSFKNKLYISNYIESNYNEDLSTYAGTWSVEEDRAAIQTTSTYSYKGMPCVLTEVSDYRDEYGNPIPYIISIGNQSVQDWIRKNKDSFFKTGNNYLYETNRSQPVYDIKSTEDIEQDGSILELQATSDADAMLKFAKAINHVDYKNIERESLAKDITLFVDIYTIGNENTTVYAEQVSAGTDTTWFEDFDDFLAGSLVGFNPKTGLGIYNTDGDGYQEYKNLSITYKRTRIIPELKTGTTNVYTAKLEKSDATINYTLDLSKADLVLRNDIENINQTTLIPYQSYKFYIHYIKNTGEITNGYYIGSLDCKYDNDIVDTPNIIYPKFVRQKDTLLPEGYIGHFFSIYKYKNTVAQLINGTKINGHQTYDCLDIDTLEIPIHKNITVVIPERNKAYDELAKYSAIYVDSGDVNEKVPELFGASGKVVLETTDDVQLDQNAFLVIESTKNEENIVLTKCTPYYDIESYEANDYQNYNLVDYICLVSKNVLDTETTLYISGNDGYTKSASTTEGDALVSLDNKNDKINVVHTDHQYIYSTFNLNLLELTNDIKKQIRTYTEKIGNNDSVTKHQILKGFDSLTLSDLYTLPSMYKNYTRKQYFIYDKDAVVEFNNTIRSSDLEGDEAKTYIYKFSISDYYNVPTDKGAITNLAGVGDIVLVHTQDSIFKFTGKPALANSGSDVQTVESDIFDTGIQEIIGSEHGFAGLRNKEHSLLCQYGYIFWDADANVIYFYAGEGQMAPISDPIDKLLHYKDITDIKFCCDYYNDRFFIRIKFVDNYRVTLSYNVKAKAFVSIHDFSFDYTFNTKVNTYFIKQIAGRRNSKGGLLGVMSRNNYKYGKDLANNFVYGEMLYPTKTVVNSWTKYAAIDIIVNDNYETIKTLDSISWICNEINKTFDPYASDKQIEDVYLAEETLNRQYCGDFMCIYTDSCATELIDILQSSNDYALYKEKRADNTYHEVFEDERPKDNYPTDRISESYKLPRFNLGKWSYNYFRNILNADNITRVPSGVLGFNQDQHSLMYGKYFVIRLLFNPAINFKFENITVNITGNPYGNS